MMDVAQILSTASAICYVVAAISGAVALVCFFRFDIRKIVGELSGRTAKKSIEKMRLENEKADKKRAAAASNHNAKREVLAEPQQKPADSAPELGETDLLETVIQPVAQSDATTALLNDDGATALLDESIQTTAPQRPAGKKLTILDEVMLIHTEEVIA